MREVLRNPAGIVGGLLLLVVAIAALFGPLLAPYDPQQFHTVAPSPKNTVEGAPFNSRDSRSRPYWSVPSQNSALGP